MLRRLYDWTLSAAGHRHAEPTLFIVAFLESSVFLIPPDVILVTMSLAQRAKAWRLAAICTVGSVLGGLAGYAIGAFLFEAIGQPVLLSAPGSDAVLNKGKVDSINPQINPNTQGLLVIAVFDNPDGKLMNGQRLRTRVLIMAKEELSVPFAAVTQTSGQSFVFRIGSYDDLKANPGKADMEKLAQAKEAGTLPDDALLATQPPVIVGELETNLYPITEGLKPNSKVATTNLLNLKHGMPVQLIQPDASQQASPSQAN